ncbi:MAG TPA: hypothetical protein VJQ57_15795, partial [Acidimicrobiia bacterium]|nr:hypothetical protein [Acidimicrobiia bacterium]
AYRLAQGFIEATTEYDFAEIPDDLQVALMTCAERFIAWSEPRVVVGSVLTQPGWATDETPRLLAINRRDRRRDAMSLSKGHDTSPKFAPPGDKPRSAQRASCRRCGSMRGGCSECQPTRPTSPEGNAR